MIKERGRLIYRENLQADGDEATSLRAALGTDATVVLDGDHFAVIEERSVGVNSERVTFVLREWEPAPVADSIAAATEQSTTEPEPDATEPDATEQPAKRSRRG